MRPGKAQLLVSLFKAGARKGVEALVAEVRLPSSVFEWCLVQGTHITGTTTPFDFLTAIAKHSLEGILHNVKQDILLTEGEQDHLFNIEWMYRTNARVGLCAFGDRANLHRARGRRAALPAGQLCGSAGGDRLVVGALLSRHAGWPKRVSSFPRGVSAFLGGGKRRCRPLSGGQSKVQLQRRYRLRGAAGIFAAVPYPRF
jgi:hypothetical protein